MFCMQSGRKSGVISVFCSMIFILSSGVSAGSDSITPLMGNSYPARNSLADFYGATPISFAQLAEGVSDDIDVLVWVCHSRQLPEPSADPKVIASLRNFVERGGGLFLVSFAQAYIVDLGLESAVPDRMDFFRYGYNDASKWGGYFTIGIKGDARHPLFKGMIPSKEDSNAFFISGSSHINIENCFWSQKQLKQGQSLGNYFRRNEKAEILDQKDARVLNLWNLGKGKVLGYGNNLLLEDFWFNQDRQNLEMFLRNAVSFLSGKQTPRIAALAETPTRLHADDYMSPPAFPQVQPHSLNRQFPGLPYIGHWGWHAQIQYQRANRECVDMKYFKEKMIDEPFRWGANLLEFYAPGMGRNEGYPFIWAGDDPIGKSSWYWGGDWAQGWNNDTVRELIKTAHDRDMLVQFFYHPDPIRFFPSGTEKSKITEAYQDFCRFQAREFQNPLLYGWRSAHDGVGAEWWGNSQAGEFISQIWPYNPGAYKYSTALLPKTGPYFHGSWMCAFARTGGINACGYGDRWRNVYYPPLYLSYQADCRSLKPSTREWGGWANYGGGSTPDWILRQTHDFARDRLYLDSGLWWLGEPAATMTDHDRQFVYGSSTDPLRCAVTTTMRAVGSDGYRAKAYKTVPNLPEQYICEEPYPQDTAFIQNNYFRLLRMAGEDKGILQYDPTRLAHFHETDRPHPAQVLSPDFITAAPLDVSFSSKDRDQVAWKIGTVDNSCSEFKKAGGYERCYNCTPDATQFPAQISYERWPDWPHEIQVNFIADTGRYELQIYALANDYGSTMEVEMDGRPIGYYFPTPGDDGKHIIPVSLDSSKQHQLRFRVQKANTSTRRKDEQPGLAHAFDAIVLSRIGDQSVVHRSGQPIGHQAVLDEVAYKDPAGAYRQQRRYTVDSDFPLLKIQLTNHAPKPTAWQTRIKLPEYGQLTPCSSGKEAVWELQPKQESMPKLVLVDYSDERPNMIKEGEDILISSVKSKDSTINLGLLINDGLYDEADCKFISRIVTADETTITVGDKPAIHKNKLNVPRVETLRIKDPYGGPYMVAEQNQDGQSFWLTRGAQPAGEVDLLKLYMQPNETARIQRYGYIDGIVKPGFGCQNALAIKDNIRPGLCEVEVIKTGPFLFAPRLDWKQAFDTVKVNGKDWRYFDDNLVYLPNKPGQYRVEVQTSGRNRPSLGRTFLHVENAVWNEKELALELTVNHPHWWQGPLPGNIPYTAYVLAKEYVPVRIVGNGSIVDWNEYEAADKDLQAMKANGFMLRLNPGKLKIYVQKRPKK